MSRLSASGFGETDKPDASVICQWCQAGSHDADTPRSQTERIEAVRWPTKSPCLNTRDSESALRRATILRRPCHGTRLVHLFHAREKLLGCFVRPSFRAGQVGLSRHEFP